MSERGKEREGGRDGRRAEGWWRRVKERGKRGENRGWGESEVRGRGKTVGEKGRCFC